MLKLENKRALIRLNKQISHSLDNMQKTNLYRSAPSLQRKIVSCLHFPWSNLYDSGPAKTRYKVFLNLLKELSTVLGEIMSLHLEGSSSYLIRHNCYTDDDDDDDDSDEVCHNDDDDSDDVCHHDDDDSDVCHNDDDSDDVCHNDDSDVCHNDDDDRTISINGMMKHTPTSHARSTAGLLQSKLGDLI